jgi:hypothetical protein
MADREAAALKMPITNPQKERSVPVFRVGIAFSGYFH